MILVTGATGLIGTNLVRELIAQHQQVRILRRFASNMQGLDGLSFEEHIGDIQDVRAVRAALKGCSEVYHLAAFVDLGRLATKKLYAVQVEGTRQVVYSAMEQGLKKMVYVSSGTTIGYKLNGVATESDSLPLLIECMPYLSTKMEAERVVLEACQKGLPAVLVNPGYTFGPWEKNPKVNKLFLLALRGVLKFYFHGGLSLVDARDVAQGCVLAMKYGRIGERYILSNENMTYRDFFTRLNAYVGRSPPFMPIPLPMGVVMGSCFEMIEKIFHIKPPLTMGMAHLYNLKHYLSSEKARLELHYSPRSIEESIAETFRWLVEHRASSPDFLR